MDNFLQRTANKLSQADNLRVYVMAEEGGPIIGFYAINTHSVDYSDLPPKFARTRPGHGQIPAVYISMIGRDQRFRGGGYGGDLLVDCLSRIAKVADLVGVAVVLLDVLDCGDKDRTAKRLALYKDYGFQSLPANEMRMFLPVATIRTMLAADS